MNQQQRLASTRRPYAPGSYPAPPWPGGATESCTRSTRARSPTRTATASATCAGSSPGSTTSSGSASTGSGSTRRCRRRTTTGATTSPTTAASTRSSARSRTSTRWSPRPAGAASACCSTWSPTTRATATRGSRTRSPAARAPRLLRVGDPATRRQQLAVELRRLGVDARRGLGPVLPATTSCPRSPTSTGGTRRCARRSTTCCASGTSAAIAGFRIDVCHAIVKDRELRDDPAATPDDHPQVRERGTRQVFSMNRPEVHDVLKRWRQVADPDRILVGETYVLDARPADPVLRHRRGPAAPRVQLPVRPLGPRRGAAAPARRGASRRSCPPARGRCGRAPTTTRGGSPRAGRAATRRRARAALLMLLTLRGTPFLYYGDEIALPDAALDPAKALDPVPRRTGDPSRNRDGCRTPMQWTAAPGAGFTTAPTPWLPFADGRNVAAQREDPGSTLHLVRDLIALRRERADLRDGRATRRCRRPTARGPGGAASGTVVGAQPLGRRGRGRGRRHRARSAPTAADGERRRARSAPWEGVVARWQSSSTRCSRRRAGRTPRRRRSRRATPAASTACSGATR